VTPAGDQSPTVVLLSTDLMLISSVGGTASQCGLPFAAVRNTEGLRPLTGNGPVILCVDLSVPGLVLDEVTACLSGASVRDSIAFGPHVHQARLDAARAAGFDKVMSRGQFVSNLSALLSRPAPRD
jgi:hypothetical protein